MIIFSQNVYDYVGKMKKDAANIAFRHIKARIMDFQLLPGVKISDEEVAKTLGTSRTPVRESLNRLAELGLVEARKNRGFRVKIFKKKEIEELYELRSNLECLAVRLTISLLTAKRANTLRNLLNSYPSVMRSNDLASFNDADEKFHDLIASYSENRLLYETLKNLKDKIRVVRRYDHLRSGSFEETRGEHKKILDLIIKGDAAKAERAMSSHILNSMKVVMSTVGK